MNSQQPEIRRFLLDKDQLPAQFPTHRHSALFWEHLGRAIATFGFLEEVLARAIFAFTATRKYNSSEEANVAYEAWLPQLEQVLVDQLWNLAEKYGKAVRENQNSTILNVNELVIDIQKATKIRNVLCHGSWGTPDEAGKSLPLFVNKDLEKFDTPIDVEYLLKVQRHVADLSCAVINTVTHMGWQFPGSSGPGKTIWPKA